MLKTNARKCNLTAGLQSRAGIFETMIIRLATLFDVPAIMAMMRQIIPVMQAAGNQQWDDEYPSSKIFTRDIAMGQLWVAEMDEAGDPGLIGGVAAITREQSHEYAAVGWDITEPAIVIHRLAVDPDFRGFGIATALMEEAEALAQEAGISVLRVDTSKQNAATQKLFPKLGYTLAGETGLSYRPGLRILCYEKRLANVGR